MLAGVSIAGALTASGMIKPQRPQRAAEGSRALMLYNMALTSPRIL